MDDSNHGRQDACESWEEQCGRIAKEGLQASLIGVCMHIRTILRLRAKIEQLPDSAHKDLSRRKIGGMGLSLEERMQEIESAMRTNFGCYAKEERRDQIRKLRSVGARVLELIESSGARYYPPSAESRE